MDEVGRDFEGLPIGRHGGGMVVARSMAFSDAVMGLVIARVETQRLLVVAVGASVRPRPCRAEPRFL